MQAAAASRRSVGFVIQQLQRQDISAYIAALLGRCSLRISKDSAAAGGADDMVIGASAEMASDDTAPSADLQLLCLHHMTVSQTNSNSSSCRTTGPILRRERPAEAACSPDAVPRRAQGQGRAPPPKARRLLGMASEDVLSSNIMASAAAHVDAKAAQNRRPTKRGGTASPEAPMPQAQESSAAQWI